MKVSWKAMRVHNNLTQEEVTALLGKKDPKIIMDIESGKRDITVGEMTKLCEIYHCTMDDIDFSMPKILEIS